MDQKRVHLLARIAKFGGVLTSYLIDVLRSCTICGYGMDDLHLFILEWLRGVSLAKSESVNGNAIKFVESVGAYIRDTNRKYY